MLEKLSKLETRLGFLLAGGRTLEAVVLAEVVVAPVGPSWGLSAAMSGGIMSLTVLESRSFVPSCEVGPAL
jgi:hypothetical protein